MKCLKCGKEFDTCLEGKSVAQINGLCIKKYCSRECNHRYASKKYKEKHRDKVNQQKRERRRRVKAIAYQEGKVGSPDVVSMTDNAECLVCGKKFYANNDNNKKFCSLACYNKFLDIRRERWATQANEIVDPDPMFVGGGEFTNCVICGKMLNGQKRACSESCRVEFSRRQLKYFSMAKYVDRQCNWCDIWYTPTNSDQRYCSAACEKAKRISYRLAYVKDNKQQYI